MPSQANTPVLKMITSFKGRHVYPTPIPWEIPPRLSLVRTKVRVNDQRPDPLPAGQPFVITAQERGPMKGFASVSINEKEYALWEPAFSLRRKLILSVEVDGDEREFPLNLTHVRIIPADFQLLALDAARSGRNAIARVIYDVWFSLRKVFPHRIADPVAGAQVQVEPVVSNAKPAQSYVGPVAQQANDDAQAEVRQSDPPPPASARLTRPPAASVDGAEKAAADSERERAAGTR